MGEGRDSGRAFSFSMYNTRVSFLYRYRTWILVGFFALVCATVWWIVYAQAREHAGVVTVAVLDIGQGDAIFIQGPTGIQMLVDAGPNTGAVLRALPRVMPWWDRSLDAALETHPDADHMGGFIDVFDRYDVGAFITPGVVKHNTTTDALDRGVDKEHAKIYVARRGMVVDLGGGAYLRVLYPNQDVSGWGQKSNDGSIVAQLVYGSTTAMLTGDAAFETEEQLIALGEPLESDILKVGHHGSRSSTGDAFIRAVRPSIALISVGKNNSYGHPTQEVLGRLSAAGVPVMRTDKQGTIVCTLTTSTYFCR